MTFARCTRFGAVARLRAETLFSFFLFILEFVPRKIGAELYGVPAAWLMRSLEAKSQSGKILAFFRQSSLTGWQVPKKGEVESPRFRHTANASPSCANRQSAGVY